MRAVVSLEQLGALAAQVPREAPRPERRAGLGSEPFDLEQWLAEHGLQPRPPREWKGGRLYVFDVCPWNEAHTDRSAYVIRHASGALDAGCHHNGCQGRDWAALRELVEPGHRDRLSRNGRTSVALVATVAPEKQSEPARGTLPRGAAPEQKSGRRAPQDLEPEALYGLPGDIIRAIEPHTESHPAALLASFVTGAGCMLGRDPYVYRDGARHAPNEFALLVGLSGVSRKGTASRRIEEFFSSNDSNYTKLLSCHGLGSGEALVASLCEDGGEGAFADRRRIVFEEEFSRALKVMRREGSTLSENLRSAWDAGILASRTKGKRMEARDAHVAVLGHITEDELRRELGAASLFNGFANRFLWVCTRRVRSLPFGGGEPPLAALVQRFHETLLFAAKAGRMEFDEETRWAWTSAPDGGGVYDLLTERPPGLLGAVTSRAEAHVTRLALFWALMDLDREIRMPHLLAALAFWDYSEKSCAYLFGRSTGNDYADQIEELLSDAYPGFLTRKEIRDHYQRHAPAGSIPEALELLEQMNRAERRKLPSTGGKSPEAWMIKPFSERDGSDQSDQSLRDQRDQSDQSPLERARTLFGRGARR